VKLVTDVTGQPSNQRRVGGSPAFIAAHGITDHSDLSFDHAYTLTKLVLEEGGGPVPAGAQELNQEAHRSSLGKSRVLCDGQLAGSECSRRADGVSRERRREDPSGRTQTLEPLGLPRFDGQG
jgi:hypothetical protein